MKFYKLKSITFFAILCMILSIFVYTPVQAKNNGIISGYVWLDSNGNGIREYGEPGIEGITIYSYFGNGNQYYDDTSSSSSGAYTIYTKNIGNDNVIKVNLNELKRMGYEITTKGIDNQIIGVDGDYAITSKMKPQGNVGIGLKKIGQSGTSYDLVSVERTMSSQPAKVGDTFDVKYKITPKAIPVEQSSTEKDIILVMDTSGSMNDNSKLSTIKSVAQKFVSKFNNNAKINISLVEFGDYAVRQAALTNMKNGDTYNLYNKISWLSAEGSTNIGDGLRLAYNELNNNNGHDKYIILMTDGIAEAYCSNNNGYIMGTEELTWDNIHCTSWYGNKAKPDYRIQSLDYAKKISSEKIAKSNIRTFIVGFGSGAGSNNQQIADAAKGVYKQALDESTVGNVYDEIQKKIDTQVQGSVNFQETFNTNLEVADINEIPAGLKVDGNKIAGNFNVDYVLNDSKTQYVTNPIEFTVKYKVKAAGSCVLGEGGKSSFAQLILSQKTDTKYLGELKLTAAEVNQPTGPLIDAARTIDVKQVKEDGTFVAKYTITPKDIVAKQDSKEKDIVLVIDISGSMDYIPSADRTPYYWGEKSRLDIIKNVAYSFINKFDGNEKVNISVITFSSKANKVVPLTNMKNDDIGCIYDKISALDANGSTNIGDGLRVAYNELNVDNGHDKYMVFMTDGVAEAYSVNNNEYVMGTEVIGDSNIYWTQWNYSHTWANPDYRTKALEYAKKVASEKIAKSNIKSFIIGFGSGAGSNNQQIAEAASGVYKQALDENTVSSVYEEIQKKIEQSIYGDVHFEETFSDKLSTQNIPDGLKDKFQVSGNKLIGNFKNIEYTNDGNGNYKASPIDVNIVYKARENTEGPYVLGSGGSSSFAEVLVMDKKDRKNLNEVSIEGASNKEANIKTGIFTGNIFEEKSELSMVKGFSVNLAVKVQNIKNGDISVAIDNAVKISDIKVYRDTDLNNSIEGLRMTQDQSGFKITLSNNEVYGNYVIVYKSMVNKNSNVRSVSDIITVNSKTKVEKHNITLVDLPPVQ
ncbi:VWA domain-containing protein [Clostridium aciditolerans]|uniref:VWA domain-containing protein n=1 Tax=Clostridium aciditolerans TaxID=339861 RepID=A0A934I0F9_9CLOT|nr:VWA domain-containing protein [Clostridium aciditolerans]MBI6873857.1 VWA domain-containing protein [Clostridium aciditolerans]